MALSLQITDFMKHTIVLLLFTAACIESSPKDTEPAYALDHPCHLDGDPKVPWFKPGGDVDVWITSNREFSPLNAVPLPLTQVEMAVRQAANIWNEESGANIRIRYRGVTTAGRVDGAIVITGRAACGNAATTYPKLDDNEWDYGSIEFMRQTGAACSNINWQTTTNTGVNPVDFVAVLLHELGHAVFNIADISSQPGATCPDVGQVTIMRGSLGRTLSNWDIELAQHRYGSLADRALFHKVDPASPSGWETPIVARDAEYLRPLFRPGSMSQGARDAWFGWVYGPEGDPQTGGGGRADVNYDDDGSHNWLSHTAPYGALGRPVAVAFKPTEELLLAYQKAPAEKSEYTTNSGQICWRSSQNYGVTWSPEICPKYATADAYGLTATYDEDSDTFVIGFTQQVGARLRLFFLVVPTRDNGVTPQLVTATNIESFHGPAVACGGREPDVSSCLVAYQQHDALGTLGWTRLSVDRTTGVIAVAPPTGTANVIQDTPGLVYVATDDTFRLVHTLDRSFIRSFRIAATGGQTWQSTGVVFLDPEANVSSSVLTALLEEDGATVTPQVWFVRHW